jgi:hypothetical protein
MGDSGILEAIGRAEAGVRREADRQVRKAQAWRDDELARYGQLRSALNADSDSPAEKAPQPAVAKRRHGPKGRVKRKPLSPASHKELADRRDKVHRLIEESREPAALGAICRTLGLTSHKAKIAVQGLMEEKRIEPIGSGSATRYVPCGSDSGRLTKQAPTQGTRDERILAILEDRHQATGEELAQALREPLRKVVEACGRLQGEERVSMSNFNGRQVYVLAVRV